MEGLVMQSTYGVHSIRCICRETVSIFSYCIESEQINSDPCPDYSKTKRRGLVVFNVP